MTTVIGYFDSIERADSAASALIAERFAKEKISVIAREGSHRTSVQDASSDGAGTASGATTGAVMGGAFGVALALGALVIPGIGPVLAAGPLAAALAGGAAGAAAGGVAGGLVGALVDAGIPRDRAEHYAEGLRRGGAIVTVSNLTDAEALTAERLLDDSGAGNITERASGWRNDATTQPF